MGASLPALIQWHACEGGRGLCRGGVAAWVEDGARGGLDKLTKGRARGARTSRAGTLALGWRAVLRWPPRDGRTEGTRRPPNMAWGGCLIRGANLGASCAARSPAARTADWAKSRRVLSGTRRPPVFISHRSYEMPYHLNSTLSGSSEVFGPPSR